ncbi:MAG: response regulator [Hydrogenimonas sp.]|nr:response regulator [Hydrogenimonas sp.]
MEIENPLESCTLLYVEDDREIRRRVTPFLASRVNTLWIAEDGRKGLELFEKRKPDIVVTDLNMPKMDGIKMSKAIRVFDKDTPIILTASYGDDYPLFAAIKAQINAFLPKPVKINDLLKTVEATARDAFAKHAQFRTQSALAQHYLAIEDSALLIYLDKRGRIERINEGMLQLLGYSHELLVGEPFENILYRDHNFNKYDKLFAAFEKRESWHGEVNILTQLDREYIFKATLIPIYDTMMPSYRFMMLLDDITEVVNYRKLLKNELDKTQDTLYEKIHFLEQYQNAINEGTAICRFLEDGTILKTDKRFEKIFGFRGDELVRRSFYQLCPNLEKDLRLEVAEAIKNRSLLRKRIKCKDMNGRVYVSDSVFIPIYRINGEIEEIISIHNDITDIINLNEEIKNTQKELLYILGDVVENRSQETGHHVKRVAEYSRILGKLAGLSEADTELLEIVAPMHDVGKIAIPDKILLKPGKLGPDEEKIIKEHTVIGGELFGNSERSFMKAARIVALEHHERYDGKGYPYGKKGSEIHIFGRIVAIADVFDALSVERSYKKAWPVEDIVEFMKRESGKMFDPNLIDLFIENLDLFLEVRRREIRISQ